MNLAGKHVDISVLFSQVRIEIDCGDDYEAQVVFDDICDTMKRGGKFTLTVDDAAVTNEPRDQ